VVFFVFSIGCVTVATAWYFFYWFWNCCDSVVFFSTVPKPIEKIPRSRNSYKTNRKKYKKYQAVATVPKTNKKSTKNAKLSQQLQNQ
jgi:hypothetical protein